MTKRVTRLIFNEYTDMKDGELKESESSSLFDGMPAEESIGSWEEIQLKKKIKNLTAMLIVVSGLFIGSLYVDIAQLVSKSGFSERALSQTNVVSAAGKTWVAYDQPKVSVSVFTDSTCETCDTSEALVWLRRIMPTVSAEEMDISKDESARKRAESVGVTTLPAFLFSKEVIDLPIYAQAEQLFKTIEGSSELVLDTAQVGIPVGKYLELPTIGEQDITVGSKDATVRVVEFTDFQCPFCKKFHETLQSELKAYGDTVLYVFKQYPIASIHPQAEGASLASECANEQGKFLEYSDTLFAKQDEWGKLTGTQKFKDYARTLKLDTGKFNTCLDEKKYETKMRADMEEGKKFGISGTPGTFVNGTFLNGAVPAEDLKAAIDAELGVGGEEMKANETPREEEK